MIYETLYTYKQKIKKIFLKNQNLQKLIYYAEDNPLSQPNLLNPNVLFKGETITNGTEIIENPPLVVFKSRNDDLLDKKCTFLLIRFLPVGIPNSIYCDVKIIITIATHTDLAELYDGKDRITCICNEIDKTLNNYDNLGIGNSEGQGTREISINKDFLGVNLIYSVSDFGTNLDNKENIWV